MDDAAAVDFTVEAANQLALDPGRWRLVPLTSGWAATDGVFFVRTGESRVVWVSSIAEAGLRVLVTDETGAAIEGASVRWACPDPWSPAETFARIRWSPALPTDSAGVTIVDLPAQRPLRIAAHARGFISRMVSITDVPHEMTLMLGSSTETPITLEVTDADSKLSIPHPMFVGSYGPLLSFDIGGGRHEIHGLGVEQRIEVSATGYCAREVTLAQGQVWPAAVELSPGTLLTLVSESEVPAIAWLSLDEQRASDAAAARSSTRGCVDLDAHGTAETMVPRRVMVTIDAVDSSGRRARQQIETTDAEERVSLRFLDRAGLILTVGDSQGHALSARTTSVTYRTLQTSVCLTADSSGAFVVPPSDDFAELRIQADGFEEVRLVPAGEVDLCWRGELRVGLRPVFPTTFRLETAEGRRLAGLDVNVAGTDGREAIRMHPRFHGSWPTEHPGWVVQRSPWRRLLSGGDGSVSTFLPEGNYSAWIEVPLRLRAEVSRSGYKSNRLEFSVSGPSTVELRGPDVRSWLLEGRDAASGRPLERLVVLVGSGAIDQAGAAHEIWLPDDIADVVVSSPGYVATRVDYPGHEQRVVPLTPREPAVLRFDGMDTAALEGMHLQVLAWRYPEGDETCLWQTALTLDGSVETSLAVPLDPPVLLRIHATDESIRFEGIQPVWDGQNEVRFRAIPRKPK